MIFLQVYSHMEDAHGIVHDIDNIIAMVFLKPYEKQVVIDQLNLLLSSIGLMQVILEKVMPLLMREVEKAKGKMREKSEVVIILIITS